MHNPFRIADGQDALLRLHSQAVARPKRESVKPASLHPMCAALGKAYWAQADQPNASAMQSADTAMPAAATVRGPNSAVAEAPDTWHSEAWHHEFSAGDRVRCTHTYDPTWFCVGDIGTVLSHDEEGVWVKFDKQRCRFEEICVGPAGLRAEHADATAVQSKPQPDHGWIPFTATADSVMPPELAGKRIEIETLDGDRFEPWVTTTVWDTSVPADRRITAYRVVS